MGNIQSCPVLFLRESNSSEISGSVKAASNFNIATSQPSRVNRQNIRQMILESSRSADPGSLCLTAQNPVILAVGPALSQLTAIDQAASCFELSCSCANSFEDAVNSFREERPTVLIVELRRDSNLDPNQIIKFICESWSVKDCTIIGTTDSNTLENDEGFVSSWLKQGVDQIVVGSSSSAYWINQFTQIIRGPVEQLRQESSSRVLSTALNRSRDIVQVTDSNNQILWVNSCAAKELGWTDDEIRGSNISSIQTTGHTAILNDKGSKVGDDQWLLNRIREGKEWEGPINCKRKTGDYIALSSKIIPILSPNTRELSEIIYIKQCVQTQPSPALNRHVHNRSIRRPSVEITPFTHEGSVRRRSSGKTNTVAIEAPINKVLNIILAAQENQPVYIAQALDKVVEILKASASSDLFNPELLKNRKGQDLVTKDLLGALLANPGFELPNNQKRRSSSEKIVSFHPRPSLPTLEVAPVQIVEVLAAAQDWGFDIFRLEEQTERRPLVWLGMNILHRFNVLETLGVEEQVLQNWLTLIESNYHSQNSYHNSTHAADVLQASAYFLEKPRIQEVLDPVDQLIVLIGAIIHDVDHPGRNSAFLCNSGSELAVLYNDTTVLENHHCALGYKLTISDPSVNIFKNLDTETYRVVRKGLIDTVLATDMSKHFVLVNKFNTALQVAIEDDSIQDFGIEVEDRGIIRRMLIKCADVSNPARPLNLCKEWAIRIAEEYFAQTAEEKELGLPVVMPQFDRTSCSIPQSQLGFYDYFITSMFDAWHGFIDCPELVSNIETNYDHWKTALSSELDTGNRIKYTMRQVEKAEKAEKDKHRLKTVEENKGDEPVSPGPSKRTNGDLKWDTDLEEACPLEKRDHPLEKGVRPLENEITPEPS